MPKKKATPPQGEPTPVVQENLPDFDQKVPDYSDFTPILDRVLIKRVALEAPDQEDAFRIPEQYRQHTNVGVVVKLGQFMYLSGNKVPLDEILKVGDLVLYGEYNAERLRLDDDTLWVVRIQQIRGYRREVQS